MQKDETRRLILASAYALFERNGYDKTTMRELASKADVALGTIFKHFPDKPSLLLSVYREDIETVFQNIADTMPVRNVRLQLTHIAAELYAFLAENQLLSRVILKEMLFDWEISNKLGKPLITFSNKIDALITNGIERGELDRKTNCPAGTRAFISFLLFCLVEGLREPEFDPKKQTFLFVSLLDNYFAGSITDQY